jgi:cell division protein ZapA (FtsZ GTPase activity inhibitor)
MGETCMDSHVVRVTVLGNKLSVRTDAPPEQLSSTISFIEEKAKLLKTASIAADPLKLSILLNIILADELIKANKELVKIRQTEFSELEKADQLASDLIELISHEIE